jgi:hypothetical protein
MRTLVTDFDTAMPEVLSMHDAHARILNYRQTEKMENSKYIKNLLVLIKVHEQYCGPYRVHKVEEKKIERRLSAEVDAFGEPLDDNTIQI